MSTETLLQASGLDMAQELERRKTEAESVDSIFLPRQTAYTLSGDEGAGRPVLDEAERTSDQSNAETGAQPKPSNPNGSL